MSELTALSYVADTGVENRSTPVFATVHICVYVCVCVARVRTCVASCVHRLFQNRGSIEHRVQMEENKNDACKDESTRSVCLSQI